uniref:Putative secreted peptide n=1 Tax=Anopheles braziliensis TaxID=58242 RepID=A0A2M3ZW57_9DIPT
MKLPSWLLLLPPATIRGTTSATESLTAALFRRRFLTGVGWYLQQLGNTLHTHLGSVVGFFGNGGKVKKTMRQSG